MDSSDELMVGGPTCDALAAKAKQRSGCLSPHEAGRTAMTTKPDSYCEDSKDPLASKNFGCANNNPADKTRCNTWSSFDSDIGSESREPLHGYTVDAQAMKEHGTQELAVLKADGSADEERYQEALRIVGNTLLAKAAVKNAEAAFTVWMHNVKKSYPYHSKEYHQRLKLFTKTAALVRETNAIYNADGSAGEDICNLENFDLADEHDFETWTPGAIMGHGIHEYSDDETSPCSGPESSPDDRRDI